MSRTATLLRSVVAALAAGLAAAFAVVAIASCASHDGAGHDGGASVTVTSGSSAKGLYTLSWTTTPSPIVVGETFVVDTTLQDKAGVAVTGAKVALDAYMPEHGHGMEGIVPLTEEVTATAGLYRTKGMRLQMPGQWELRWTLDGAPGKDSAALKLGAK